MIQKKSYTNEPQQQQLQLCNRGIRRHAGSVEHHPFEDGGAGGDCGGHVQMLEPMVDWLNDQSYFGASISHLRKELSS